MESILRSAPSLEQLLEELDSLKKKILFIEKNNVEHKVAYNQLEINDYPALLKIATKSESPFHKDLENEMCHKLLNEVSELKKNILLEKQENLILKEELLNTKNSLEESKKEINKSKKRSQKLFTITKQLKTANADLENFIYSASHDLRSPISNLEGLVQILKNELGEKTKSSELDLMHMITTSISRFKQTIFDLTELSTFQKQGEEAKEPVNIDEVLGDVKTNIYNKIEESRAIIETDFKVSEIKFARKNLRSIIFNLLINAVKYRSPRRPLIIKLTSRQKGKNIIFEIEDNGLGFLPEQKDKMFQMFKRLHTHVDGTGVGLYIVKKIIENAGGRIEVESELDKGSKFKIFFKG